MTRDFYSSAYIGHEELRYILGTRDDLPGTWLRCQGEVKLNINTGI